MPPQLCTSKLLGLIALLFLLLAPSLAWAEVWNLDGRYESSLQGTNTAGTHSHHEIARIHIQGNQATYQLTDNGDLIGGVETLEVEDQGSRILFRLKSCAKTTSEGTEVQCAYSEKTGEVVHILERCKGERARCLIGRGQLDDGIVFRRVRNFRK